MVDAPGTAPAIDAALVGALADEVLDWRHKAVPALRHGGTARDLASGSTALADLQTPVLTLESAALTHNRDRMAAWCREHGVLLAPHGKTTMAPSLWADQLEYGAWGITLATPAQLRVARRFGVHTLMLANSLTDPQAVRWVADEVAGGARIVSWVDDVRTVELIDEVLDATGDAATDAAGVRLEVVVELGGAGGRTGARSVASALDVARAVGASRHLSLAGVGGYEGSLAHTADETGLTAVRDYLTAVRALHERLLADGAYPGDALITAGGSAYFDDVVEILGPCATGAPAGTGRSGGPRVDVVLRSGAYLIHDDGFYRGISPFSRQGPDRPEGAAAFHSAMHAWARVVSAPEPGLAILDAGKRDLPVDEGMPVPQLIGPGLGAPMRPLTGARITAVNDQHCYLVTDPDDDTAPRPGDVVRLGLSHPCTAMDKWTLIPVIDDASRPEDAVVVDTVRTFF
ncbi:amino acid deaminase [Tersicoccus sp. Bi-70]|uniref:amino acid deaminase n=1 Tax=Tersicoccus sp. Bi-70 TaxID=1897634 RepID=UPI000978C7AE|nr:amino acid deaminase [Tersicoccus sp. Bi-70]OMH32343.1 amino acid deaminase [Tersicoccus sp. Bi-70]